MTRDEWMDRFWPKHIAPAPTEAEWEAAKAKWQEFCREHPDDMSDFTFDFNLTVGTYAPYAWARFFGLKVEPPDFSKLIGAVLQ